ncbi:MAG: GNAT family N-acetyltransferase [Mucilaginibacter sp.]
MEHVLDNPAWNALLTGNKHLGEGNEQVKYYIQQVSPFVGFRDNNAADFEWLYNLMTYNGPAVFITPVFVDIPHQWKIARRIICYQMLYEGDYDAVQLPTVALTHKDIPQMMALTQLTNPGPFLPRTIEFGHYEGIFEGDKLIAMAGQRMHPVPYAEISAVCTHPDHLGKGYARQLLLSQANRIKAEGNIPFLHVRDDNYRALKVYKGLGFVTRQQLHFYVLTK